jgi:Ca-activated chloride channel homolog
MTSSNGETGPSEARGEQGGLRGFIQRHPLSFRAGIGLTVLAASIVALVLSQRVPPVKASAIGARLELASGEVTLKEGDGWPSVVSGIPLPTGAELATGKGARALVRLADGSSVFLRGDSKVALEAGGLALQQGEVWLDAPPSERGGLAHKLGDVTVSATDAGLSMKRAGSDVSVYVTRGLAVITSPGGRVEVNAGEQATIAAAAAPKVAPLAYWEDWTGGMGDHRPLAGEGSGSGRIYGVDLGGAPGSVARTLEISRQVVRAVLRDGLAETEVDQTFSNPGGRQVEGWYWFTVPERAIVSSFAVETNGALIEGEIIEKQEAAARYQAAVRASHEPALLEWIDGRSYRARIFPVPASGSRRVVLRYIELLPTQSGKFAYVYPMRSNDPVQIGEFSLSVDLGDAGKGMPLATLADAVIEDGGRRVSMRRSGYEPRADFQLEGTIRAQRAPFRVSRFAAGSDRADYVMARYVPDVNWAEQKDLPGDLVVVVDTSASADEAARQQKSAAAEAILRAMSPSDHFALIALDSTPTILYPKDGLADASEKEIAVALERLAEHSTGGATDLGSMFDVALGRVHGKDQPAVIYIGDGLPTSGEVSGEQLAERLRRSLSVSRARFFTVAVGPDANHSLLRELARAGGGQWFTIDQNEGSTSEVLRLASAIKTPTITDLSIELGAGLDEPMLTASGKVSRGEEVVLLARTHHALPTNATVKGRLGGKDFSMDYPIEIDRGVGTAFVPRLWASEKIRRLLGEGSDVEAHRGKIVELGLEYGLVTPFTSTLALESEQAYQHQGIPRRRSPLRGVRLTELTPRAEREIIDLMSPIAAPPAMALGCSKMEASASRAEEASPAPVAQPQGAAKSDYSEGKNRADQPFAQATAVAAAPAPEPASVAEPPADKRVTADMERERQAPARPGAAGAKQSPQKIGAENGWQESDEPIGGAINERRLNAKPKMAPAAPPPPPPPVAALPRKTDEQTLRNKAGDDFRSQLGKDKSKEELERRGPAAAAKSIKLLAPCSDSARRPLAERIVLWSKRLRGVSSADELIARYEGARSTCEIPDWRAQSALLQLIQAKVRTEGATETLLAHFAGERETQKYVAHAILRRSVDPRIAAVVRRILFDERMRWVELDNELAALATVEERIARLRQVMVSYPGDPQGEIRLVRLLADSNQKEEALALGRRLRDRGFMSPALALDLGDVLARSGFQDDAIRTYSEIVEFDAGSPESRRLLGDVYLRHGWYPAAYRHYKTLTEFAPTDATGWLRLAAAAAGSGRVDEALRVQRQVSAAEGTPGPNDPRGWARTLSAARLGRLLADPAQSAQTESLARKLKELQIFSGPAALRILTWEDFSAVLALSTKDGDAEATIGEIADAGTVGAMSILMPAADLARLTWSVRWRNDPPGRDVNFVVTTIVWDGKAFKVDSKPGVLPAKQKDLTL